MRPPLETYRGSSAKLSFRPLNERGVAINRMLAGAVLASILTGKVSAKTPELCTAPCSQCPKLFPEEERSKQPSIFSVLRALISEFRNDADDKLALAGAFGFDLLFQFEPIPLRLPRNSRKDLQLFLCDDIIYMDRKRETIDRYSWDFELDGVSTAGMKRTGEPAARPAKRKPSPDQFGPHPAEEYMANVETVREGMRRGDYYEVVLAQMFRTTYSGKASELFSRMQRANPSPYEFLIQFGDEQLVGASPEMFMRVEGPRGWRRAPIAGTARRTGDPLAG